MEVKADVFEPLELQYSDLVLLSSNWSSSSLSPDQLERIELISGDVMRALGPSGPGLLTISGVPKALTLRRDLLPYARMLALLGKKERAQLFKENGLGSDVPMKNINRSVSSFSMQLKYQQLSNLESALLPFSNENVNSLDSQLIGHLFRELGLCMVELGFHLAQACDRVIGGRELSESILAAGTAKGRLIHYHSAQDNLTLKKEITKGSMPGIKPTSSNPTKLHAYKVLPNFIKGIEDKKPYGTKFDGGVNHQRRYLSNLWQQWHYDYGIFTVLTSPLFMSGMNDSLCVKACSSPEDHACLQVFDSKKSRVLLVKAPPESFIIQVGESADIISNGKLRSTLHSVGRPPGIESLSRETFIVFLQPPWNKALHIPTYLMEDKVMDEKFFLSKDDLFAVEKIFENTPPLSSRLKSSMTFGEFSRETTKQYYGGTSRQSEKQ